MDIDAIDAHATYDKIDLPIHHSTQPIYEQLIPVCTPKKKKRWIISIVIILTVLVVGAGYYGQYIHISPANPGPDSASTATPQPTTVSTNLSDSTNPGPDSASTATPQPTTASTNISDSTPNGPPRGVVASPRSNSSVIVQWQPPEEEHWNGPLLGYMIRFKLSGYPDSTWEHKNITNNLTTSYLLRGLSVWQQYEIGVAAYNAKGVGMYSTNVYVRTQEGHPTASPFNLTSHAQTSTTVGLTWMPPDPQYIHGINQGYKIHARRTNATETEVGVGVIVLSDVGNMLGLQEGFLLDLYKFTDYIITVLCFTSVGSGPNSNPVQERTLQDVPEQVASLNFDNVIATSFRVLWTPPVNTNGILIGYNLTYQKKNLPITKVVKELLPTTLNYTITGLTATTVYSIEVYTSTIIGPGPARGAEITTGLLPPSNVRVISTTSEAITLSWLEPDGNYDHVLIHCSGEDEAISVEISVLKGATTGTCTGLSPRSNYTITVEAVGQSLDTAPADAIDGATEASSGPKLRLDPI